MNPNTEWLEADGLGGFAFGRADTIRTRRYHGLLTVATKPPTGRYTLVNGVEAWVETPEGSFPLTSQRYAPDVTHPDGATRIVSFVHEPWPTWTYRLPSGLEIVHEVIVIKDAPLVALSWHIATPHEGDVRFVVRPLLSGRDIHALHHENPDFRFDGRVAGKRVIWNPYDGVPPTIAVSNGEYLPEAAWYRNFQYDEESARGLDFIEDLASPGHFTFTLGCTHRALLAFGTEGERSTPLLNGPPEACWRLVELQERRRRARFVTPLHRAADAYIVRRNGGRTIIAGYPWFSDWGRDTFIALRGLCLTGNRLDDAREILLEWSRHVSEGMLPNYFPEANKPAEYNSVDASLWYVIAVHELFSHADAAQHASSEQREAMSTAVDAIVDGYARGTRHGIRADSDGLLAAGEPGVQLTWMDAKVGDWVVTPRIGKPVEIQALWINALRIAARRTPRWLALAEAAQRSFVERFWNDERGFLNDVVDVDHVHGVVDATCRPNQIFAVGGLPWPLLDGERARRVVEVVESRLWTPAGLRTLDSDDPAFIPHYAGDMRTRDGAYHQGTAWPWLMGAFIDAWVRTRGNTPDVRQEARSRFLVPLLTHFAEAGAGHIAEVADATSPFTPGGCPFQAWSVGEALRVAEGVLAIRNGPRRPRPRRIVASMR
jgi:predicted glycogen debranching enzyme